jgi:hypothetical protein
MRQTPPEPASSERAPFLWSALALALGLVCLMGHGVPAAAQAPSGQPEAPDEIAALDEVWGALVEEHGAAAYDPQQLVELSRLLSAPCDQILWLGRRIAELEAQPERAAQLADLARERAERVAGLLGNCAERWSEWIQPPALPEPPKPAAIHELLDPEELSTRLQETRQSPAELYDLPPYAKFLLLARGAEDRLVFRPRERVPEWNVPHSVIDQLAGGAQLAGMGDLLDLQRRLAAAHDSWTRGGAAGFGEPPEQQLVAASFRIVAALLDRALGLDRDLAQAAAVPYTDSPAEWTQLAAVCDQASLWNWSTLAHILAAGADTNPAVRAQALGAGRVAWQNFRRVNSQAWSAVDEQRDGWLVRLDAPDRLVETGRLPLTSDFLDPARAARRRYEAEALTALREAATGDEAAADRAFQAIQLAKAADVGRTIEPLSLAQLVERFPPAPLYLFVELIEVRLADAGGAATFAGVALYSRRYVAPMAGQQPDKYAIKALPPAPTSAQVVAAALDGGPPADRRDARILIAPDGPLPPDWFEFEKTTLVSRTGAGGTGDPSWIVYVPSAAALASPAWTLDETLRVWYRWGVHGGAAPMLVSGSPQILTARGSGPPLERSDMSLYLVSLAPGGSAADAALTEIMQTKRLTDFMKVKQREALPVVPLWVSR